jgi:RNA polymerase sigma-70 factor (ECF subfamily)
MRGIISRRQAAGQDTKGRWSRLFSLKRRNLFVLAADYLGRQKIVVPRGHKLSVVCNLADERLLIEAAQQDPSRFAELYEKNFHRVYAFVARRVRDRDEAEDVTAEVFHEALRNLGRFQWRGVPFAAWLMRIAANTLADRWQRAGQHGVLAVDDIAGADISVQAEAERRAMLAQLVDRLPPDQRLVIVRRFVDQKNVREIAQELGRSEGAIKQLQFRALETLRRHAAIKRCDDTLPQ